MNIESLTAPKNKLAVLLGLEEKTPIEAFLDWPSKNTFNAIPKEDLDPAFIHQAIENKAHALEYIPDEYKTIELCKLAVSRSGNLLRYVPQELLTDELIELAINQDGSSLQFVPKSRITRELAFLAVANTPKHSELQDCPLAFVPRKIITKKMVAASVEVFPKSILVAPKNLVSEALLIHAIDLDPEVFAKLDSDQMTDAVINAGLNANPKALVYLPSQRKTYKRCKKAFDLNPLILPYIPPRFITKGMCISALSSAKTKSELENLFKIIPAGFKEDDDILLAKQQVEEDFAREESLATISNENWLSKVNYYRITPTTASYIDSAVQSSASGIENNSESVIPLESQYSLVQTVGSESLYTNIYYISDIHIENQFKSATEGKELTYYDVVKMLDNKIEKMLLHTDDRSGYFLIGGDVANYKELVSVFYRKLSVSWRGPILFVAGNHELWDYSVGSISVPSNSHSVSSVFQNLNKVAHQSGMNTYFLQNSLYIKYKNYAERVITEKQILDASDSDLRELCLASSIVVLGGLGFSGLNSKFNAEIGLYRELVQTLDDDRQLTAEFRRVYEKVQRCIGDLKVIVLTHTPISNWTTEDPNPNWIYINGHTHHNSITRKEDGTTILSNAQIGYVPKPWVPERFTVKGLYDPLSALEDGIHLIPPHTYLDFNLGRGIHVSGTFAQGEIYALKRESLYMFVFKNEKGLYLLAGGRKNRIPNRSLGYYYSNMLRYRDLIEAAVVPYYNALQSLSKEVRLMGGLGTIHGCIVDISFFSHLYLDPTSGMILPYNASSIVERDSYRDLPALLKAEEPALFDSFTKLLEEKKLPLLQEYAVVEKRHKKKALVALPTHLFGTEMYKPSNRLRATQYLLEQNVIRIWKDDLLAINVSESHVSQDTLSGDGSRKLTDKP